MDRCSATLYLYGDGDGAVVPLPLRGFSVGSNTTDVDAFATPGVIQSLRRFAGSATPAVLRITWMDGTEYEVEGRVASWEVAAVFGEDLGRLSLSLASTTAPAAALDYRELDVTTLSDRERRTLRTRVEKAGDPEPVVVIIPRRRAWPPPLRARTPEVEEQRERVIELDTSDPSGGRE